MANSTDRILKAAERVRKTSETAAAARRQFRDLMRREIAAGNETKSSIARTLGVSRQRVGQMLDTD